MKKTRIEANGRRLKQLLKSKLGRQFTSVVTVHCSPKIPNAVNEFSTFYHSEIVSSMKMF